MEENGTKVQNHKSFIPYKKHIPAKIGQKKKTSLILAIINQQTLKHKSLERLERKDKHLLHCLDILNENEKCFIYRK